MVLSDMETIRKPTSSAHYEVGMHSFSSGHFLFSNSLLIIININCYVPYYFSRLDSQKHWWSIYINAGISRTERDLSPAHYLFKIQSYSLLKEAGVEKYETNVFEACGYKWSVPFPCIFPFWFSWEIICFYPLDDFLIIY